MFVVSEPLASCFALKLIQVKFKNCVESVRLDLTCITKEYLGYDLIAGKSPRSNWSFKVTLIFFQAEVKGRLQRLDSIAAKDRLSWWDWSSFWHIYTFLQLWDQSVKLLLACTDLEGVLTLFLNNWAIQKFVKVELGVLLSNLFFDGLFNFWRFHTSFFWWRMFRIWSDLFLSHLVHHSTVIFLSALSCTGTVSCHVTFSITLVAKSRLFCTYSRTSTTFATAWIVIIKSEYWLLGLHLLVLNLAMPLICIRVLYRWLRKILLLLFSKRVVLLPEVNRFIATSFWNI